MNTNAFSQYLTFMTPINDNTFYNDIKKLNAGNYIFLDEKNFRIEKYYDINNIKTIKRDENEVLKEIEGLLISSVKQRLVSDVEVATLLSGGIDSSLISALYSQYNDKKINTFCVGYDEHTHYSELPYARAVAKHINSNHHELIIGRKDFIETIDNIFEHTDESFADSASIPTYLLSKYINKQGIKVALSGEGSDEIFLGYENYFKMLEYYKVDGEITTFNLTKEWEYNKRAYSKEPIYQTCGEAFTEKQKRKIVIKIYPKKSHE